MTGEGIGFGKAILFNEHFVVYGVPAIVSAIGKYTIAKVEPTDKSGWNLKDNRKATPNYKEDKVGQQKDSINRILNKMNIDLSIVMAFRNEGSEPEMTVKSILETCTKSGIEILVINDASDEERDFSPYPQVRYFCNKKRSGITACRDFGVDKARSENILSIDAHMRFRKDDWLERGLFTWGLDFWASPFPAF